jgi:hypothetical protein
VRSATNAEPLDKLTNLPTLKAFEFDGASYLFSAKPINDLCKVRSRLSGTERRYHEKTDSLVIRSDLDRENKVGEKI